MVARCQRAVVPGVEVLGLALRATLRMTSDRGVPLQLTQFGVAHLGAVSGFASVAFRHPNGLDTLAVRELQQVTDGSVGRDKLSLNLR